MIPSSHSLSITAFLSLLLVVTSSEWVCAAPGRITINLRGENGAPLAGRLHIRNEKREVQRAPDMVSWNDHFVIPGSVTLQLDPGKYTLEAERGPEYARVNTTFSVDDGDDGQLSVTLKRIAALNRAGWYSGDLHIHRNPEHVELLLEAEDLNVGPVITWWNDRNLWATRSPPSPLLVKSGARRYYHLMAGEDERQGGALLYFGLHTPLPISGSEKEFPSPMTFVAAARKHSKVWIDIEKPFWWDVPVWLASGQIDSIGLANNHMCRSRMYEDEAWGRPRDEQRLPPPRGNGYWTQEIYYHLLNAGLRVPPSAGSASGVLPNPVGYNRVYVHCGDDFTYDNWWAGLKAGRSFVTNGPLLRVTVNSQLPGHVFQVPEATVLGLDIDMQMTSLDRISALEIIKNGVIAQRIAVLPQTNVRKKTRLKFAESGWFLVRAIARVDETFRFASTAPFYVEGQPEPRRISRRSAQFFVQWVDERIEVVKAALTDPAKRESVLEHHEAARRFWANKLARATTE